MRISKCVVMMMLGWVGVALSGDVAESSSNRVANVESNYYERIRCWVNSNYSARLDLLDVNNSNYQITNAVLSVDNPKDGKAFGLKLGMTMGDAVNVIGKPYTFVTASRSRIELIYGKYLTLTFRKDCLSDISLNCLKYADEKREPIRLSHILASKSQMAEFMATSGTSKKLRADQCGIIHLGICNNDKVLGLSFKGVPLEKWDDSESQHKAILCGLSLHYHGLQEEWGEAEDKFLEHVAERFGIDSLLIQSLRWTDELPDVYSILEKVIGKPLTEDQRKKVAVAFEIKQKAIEKAKAEDEKE